MADVNINKFRASVVRDGSKPASPGFIVSEGQDPVDPAGNGQNHLPVTIATAATGLSITDSQVLGGAGTVGQYIRGDGSLADFPQASGGGSSVSYYLNGSISQGTIGGVAYKELNKVPILGAGTDFTINADGYIASFLTDAGDPNLLEIPGGNWNFETYFSASSSGGSPSFYVELYKYDGTTFTLIASSSSSPELIAFGTNLNPYFSTLAVPTTTLALTDRLAVRFYVTHSGRTITLHTENNHLCQVVTTFTTGLTSLNGLTAQVQNLAVGTSGTDFNIASATATHTFNLPTASATNRGALSSADWTTFNNKQNALTNPVTGTGASGQVAYFTGTTAISSESNLFWDATNDRLGIGTATPSAKLEVNGTLSVLGDFAQTGNFVVTNRNFELFLQTDTAKDIIFRPATVEQMRIFSGGNLHIGSTPASNNGARLQVSGTARVSDSITIGPTDSVWNLTTSNKLQLQNSLLIGYTTTGTFLTMNLNFNGTWKYISNGFASLYSQDSGDHIFFTSTSSTSGANATLNEKLRITNSGNVGIGTSSPSATLDVQTSSGVGSSTASGLARFITAGTTTAISVGQSNSARRLDISSYSVSTTGEALYLSTLSNHSINFVTNSVDRAIITSSGNVGIGTSSPSEILHVYKATTFATILLQNGNNSAYSLYQAKTGNSDTWQWGCWNDNSYRVGKSGIADYLMISSSGNVLIGTTTDSGSKLRVNGDIDISSTSTSAPNLGTGVFLRVGSSASNFNGITFQGNFATDMYFGRAVGSDDLVVRSNAGERMRIFSNGNVAIGRDTDSGYKLAVRASGSTDTEPLLLCSALSGTVSHYFFSGINSTMNTADANFWVRRNGTTSRSINAAGTINASGADYAEYMLKAIYDNIEKGDIVGVNINGQLTNIFADSISFVVKSTDPSYVGGDTWFNFELPMQNDFKTKEEFDIAYEEFKVQREEARQKVDRIAFSGQIPCNVLNAKVGDYIIPINNKGKISGQAITNPTFEQYQISVGKVWKIMEDGRAWIAVKIG